MTKESYGIVREELKSNLVFEFEYKHSDWILSVVLTKDESVLFSGCYGSVLVQHSIKTLKPIGDPLHLNIGNLQAMDVNSNLLVVGGQTQFRIIKLTKLVESGNYYTSILSK